MPITLTRTHPASWATQFHLFHARPLWHFRGGWWEWDPAAGHYQPLCDAALEAVVTRFLELCRTRYFDNRRQDWIECDFHPRERDVRELLFHLRGQRQLWGSVEPAWIDTAGRPVEEGQGVDVLLANGVLDLDTGELYPPTPNYFTLAPPLACDYKPDASAPEEWLKFLESVWPGEEGRLLHGLLQEVMGLALTPTTQYHAIVMLKGPPRSGKGTICRVLKRLVGQGWAGGEADDLVGAHGTELLLGRRVLCLSDTEPTGKVATAKLRSLLLRVSGEDDVSINPKGKPTFSVRLPLHVWLAYNVPPNFVDDSGALGARLVVLPFEESFTGREDRGLESRLEEELPGILRWALEGLHRLQARGRLDVPEPSARSHAALTAASSLLGEFVEEKCALGPSLSVSRALWCENYREWLLEQGVLEKDLPTHAQAVQTLIARHPKIRECRPGTAGNGGRERRLVGVGLSLKS